MCIENLSDSEDNFDFSDDDSVEDPNFSLLDDNVEPVEDDTNANSEDEELIESDKDDNAVPSTSTNFANGQQATGNTVPILKKNIASKKCTNPHVV